MRLLVINPNISDGVTTLIGHGGEKLPATAWPGCNAISVSACRTALDTPSSQTAGSPR